MTEKNDFNSTAFIDYVEKPVIRLVKKNNREILTTDSEEFSKTRDEIVLNQVKNSTELPINGENIRREVPNDE